MPKIRGIKPETWTDDKFVQLSPLARLLFMGMWNLACDNGHVEDNLVQLKIRLLPMDSCEVGDLVEEMIQTGQVERCDGYLKVVKLPEHQKIDLFWLTLCEWCEHDERTAFTPSDRKGRKKGTSQAPDGHKSGTSLAPVAEVRGSEVRGDEVRGDARKNATKLPKDWKPTTEHQERALAAAIDLGREVEKFKAHVEEKGRTAVNWNGAFTRWLMNAEEYAQRDRAKQPKPRSLPHVSEIEQPPDGLSESEYSAWMRTRRRA